MKKFVLLTLAIASLANAETPPEWGRWAAVAFSRSKAGAQMSPIGRAYGESSEYVAKTMAIRACAAEDCEIKSYVQMGCIGIATGMDSYYRDWWGFGAATFSPRENDTVEGAKTRARKSAGEMAIDACQNATHRVCSLSEAFCTWDSETGQHTSPYAVEEWIRDMGGEGARGVANTVYLVNIVTQGYLLNVGLDYTKSSCASSRRWARLGQLARSCRLSVDDLDRLYADANRYGG